MDARKVALAAAAAGLTAGGGYLFIHSRANAEPGPEEPEQALSLIDLSWTVNGLGVQVETVEQGQTTHPLLVRLDNTGPARSFRVEVYLGSTRVISNLLIICLEDGFGSNQEQIPISESFPAGSYTVKIKAVDQATGQTVLETDKTASGSTCKLTVVEPYEPPPGPGPGPGGETVQAQLASVWNQISGAGTDYNGLAVWAFRDETWLVYQYSTGWDQIGYFRTGELVSLYNTGAQITLTYGGKSQTLAPGWNNFAW
ncbi:MAG: hypothetical protein WC551_09985 [Patescibacteria group bacterium]